MRESDIDQAERRATLENDLKVLEERRGSTYHAHTHADEISGGGRFAGINPATVVGSEPVVNYPACSPALAVQLPDEHPLGFDNPALDSNPAGYPVSAGTGPAADPAPFDLAEELRPAAGPSSQMERDDA